MHKVISETKKPIKIWASDLEAEAEKQVRNLSELPFIHSHVAVMPDAHAGKGSTVGTVIATDGAIIPAAVGVDIGCGMCAVKTPFNANDLGKPEDLSMLRHSIERSIPLGHNINKDINTEVKEKFNTLGILSTMAEKTVKNFPAAMEKAVRSIGSLGGGNHFIEICIDKDSQVWVMLHSGSRNIGKGLADAHISRAQGIMKEYFISLPDRDLAYFAQGTQEFKDYINDLMWAQKFAKINRDEMMNRILKDLYFHMGEEDRLWEVKDLFRVDCHHNYTSIENHGGKNVYVTRKGAVSAKSGEWGIIPGSMGTRSYIVRGLGNAESFCSCSHGAGRRMSRTRAREMFTIADLENQTAGVECNKSDDVLDEIPAAYKDIDTVMENQKDLVESIYELKQLICIKG